MLERVREGIERRLGAKVIEAEPLSGGDINDAYRVKLTGGESVFVKTNSAAPPTMFSTEARGLEWLRQADAIRLPKVLAASRPDEAGQFLALEWIQPNRPCPDFDERLGQQLAALHRSPVGSYGLEHDNFIGSLPQQNDPCDTWAEFFRVRRLEPQLARAVDSGRAGYAMRRGFDHLFARLPDLLGHEPPSRLHGDLWGGNLHIDELGRPCLIDPAVYGGHREVDLAMMRLFGGFSNRVFSSYEATFPLSSGAPDRVELYQLYPLMVHVNLFGGSYAGSVERALRRYA